MTRPSSRFLSQLAHDLRSPLNVIGSTLGELSADTALTAAEREQIFTLSRRAVGRLVSLSDRLALASRLDGPLELTLAPQDLVQVTRATLAGFLPDLRTRIEVVTAFPSTPVPIQADGVLLPTLLLELLANANRFARRSFRVEVQLGGEAAVIVDDDGEGVEEDERAVLFEPFAERRSRTGLGMGLWIARRLAELQLGTLTVEHLSPGTRLRLALPLWPRAALPA